MELAFVAETVGHADVAVDSVAAGAEFHLFHPKRVQIGKRLVGRDALKRDGQNAEFHKDSILSLFPVNHFYPSIHRVFHTPIIIKIHGNAATISIDFLNYF